MVDEKRGTYMIDSNKTIHGAFEQEAKQNPDRIAGVFNDKQITYKELNRRANQLSHHLACQGVEKQVVGLVVKPSFDMLIGVLAILKAGGSYLPIDVNFPLEQINYRLKQSCAKFILTDSSLNISEDECKMINLHETNTNSYPIDNLNRLVKEDDLAYVIFTSGSTGLPKGVMVEHRSVYALNISMKQVFPFVPERTILNITTLSFDISIVETLIPLMNGMKVVIASEIQRRNPRLLKRLIREKEVKIMQTTPSRLDIILNDPKSRYCLQYVSDLLIGGDRLPYQLVKEIKKITSANIYNLYGPTEATVWTSVKKIDQLYSENITIGKPFSHADMVVVDPNLRLVRDGQLGELCVSGEGVAKGYINSKELTEQKFCTLDSLGRLVYRTGDLGRKLPSGEFLVEGRMDRLTKIKGYRVNPGEIEKEILNFQGVQQCVVISFQKEQFMKLHAFFTADGDFNEGKLRSFLKTKLPEYMIPTSFKKLNDFPLTPNGKTDLSTMYETLCNESSEE